MMYYVYMVRCEDNSVYTGITTDISRRMKEHCQRGKKSAKYTARHAVTSLEALWKAPDRSSASRLEYYIKTLPKQKKELLIQRPECIGEVEKFAEFCFEPMKGITLKDCLDM